MQLYWTPPAALSILVVYQQYRFYRVHPESKRNEELFKLVTENAADMIALGDMKGRRLRNSCQWGGREIVLSGEINKIQRQKQRTGVSVPDLPGAVARRDHASILSRAAETIEHAPGFE